MAIQFLTGLNVQGNVNLNENQLQNFIVHPLGTNPTGIAGRVYYNSTSNELRLFNGTTWVNITTGADDDTTYTFNVPATTTTLRLAGSDSTQQDVSITGSGLISVTRTSATELTIGTTATNNVGTVTSVSGGDGIVITGTSTVTPTVNVDYAGADNFILTAAGETPASEDTLVFSDATDSSVKSAVTTSFTLNMWGAPTAPLSIGSQKLTNVATGTDATDGVNLAQVQSLVAGVGVFQGGYDATNDPGTPNISGVSNVALTTGDFYVVTADGDITFSDTTVTVEVGDLIFANSDITASSNPASTDYTIVIQDQNIAGVGATDGATEKGVAGFSSASFAGTASGFITIKAGGISDAQLASTFNKIIGTDTDLDTSGVDVVDQINVTDGVITSMSKRTLPNATTTAVGVTEIATQAEVDAGTDDFRYVTPLTLKTAVGKQAFSDTYPATITNSWTIDAATHGLGATQGPFVIQTYISGAQVYIDVAIASNGTITFTTTNNQAVDAVVCNIMKVN